MDTGAIRGETLEAAPSTECSQRKDTETGREFHERRAPSEPEELREIMKTEQIGAIPIAAEMGCPFQLLFHTLWTLPPKTQRPQALCVAGEESTQLGGGAGGNGWGLRWELLVGGHSYFHEGGNGCYPW